MYSKEFSFRCIAYPEKDKYVGVCLDLDIIEEHGSLESAIKSVNDAVLSHFLSAAEVGFPKELLSRPAPKEYWDKLKSITCSEINPKEKNHLSEFSFYKLPIKAPSFNSQ